MGNYRRCHAYWDNATAKETPTVDFPYVDTVSTENICFVSYCFCFSPLQES